MIMIHSLQFLNEDEAWRWKLDWDVQHIGPASTLLIVADCKLNRRWREDGILESILWIELVIKHVSQYNRSSNSYAFIVYMMVNWRESEEVRKKEIGNKQ